MPFLNLNYILLALYFISFFPSVFPSFVRFDLLYQPSLLPSHVCLQSAIESLFGASLTGVAYSLFAGQPLTILGSTGPVLVFEKILFKFCKYVYLIVALSWHYNTWNVTENNVAFYTFSHLSGFNNCNDLFHVISFYQRLQPVLPFTAHQHRPVDSLSVSGSGGDRC